MHFDAVDDTVITHEDTTVTTGNVLANDTDLDSDTLTIDSFTQPAHGTVTHNGDGTFDYTPEADYHGTDRFTYTVSDGEGGTDTATVEVHTSAVADAPTLEVPSVATGQEGSPIPLQIQSSLVDTDGSETLTITIRGVPEGTLFSAGTNRGDGIWTFQPMELDGLTFTPPVGGDASVRLMVEATATDAGGDTAVTSHAIDLSVTSRIPLESSDHGKIDWTNDTDLRLLDPESDDQQMETLLETTEELLDVALGVQEDSHPTLDVGTLITGGSHEEIRLSDLDEAPSVTYRLTPVERPDADEGETVPLAPAENSTGETHAWDGQQPEGTPDSSEGGIPTYLWGLLRGIGGMRSDENKDNDSHTMKPR